ncbi:MAG: hypothetical protein K2Y14_09835 [Burkholderiales bacterium]|nr:hypothetical protein [Burkholderiales bacterium]
MQPSLCKLTKLIIYSTLPLLIVACNQAGSSSVTPVVTGIPLTQQSVPRIELMNEIPQPFQIIDYKLLAESFDQTAFNWNANGESWPIIWMDYTYQNFNQPTFGLYTAIGDVRQGPNVESGIVHEAMAGMGSVLSATLVGIDKSNQDGMNYVAMLKNYFNRDNQWDIMMNNTNYLSGAAGGGYGRDWWYDIFPNIMFYAIAERYSEQQDFIGIERSIADKFYAANQDLAGNYGYFYYNYQTMLPGVFPAPPYTALEQQDAAAGHSWVLYAAYQKFGDAKYLAGSISSLTALEALPYSLDSTPSYEVLMPFGAYMAARLNAEQAQHFNVQKMLDWSFNGKGGPRPDWGVIVGTWNGIDVSGMVGSTTDRGGYGFLMDTYDMAWPIVPLVRYDQAYANMVGKWMLNAANVSRMFYPQYMPESHQTLYNLRSMTKDVIAYEGIINQSGHVPPIAAPVAQGDGPGWATGNPPSTEFGIYGSSHVGIFGSIISFTSESTILQLNLLATDSYHPAAYPSYLYYNPNAQEKTITLDLVSLRKGSTLINSSQAISLYDTVSAKVIAQNLTNATATLTIPAYSSRSLVVIPSAGNVTISGTKLLVNNIVIDYHFQKDNS